MDSGYNLINGFTVEGPTFTQAEANLNNYLKKNFSPSIKDSIISINTIYANGMYQIICYYR